MTIAAARDVDDPPPGPVTPLQPRSPSDGRPDAPRTPMGQTQPVTGRERLHLLDALRGFALAGVLLANLREFSLFSLIDDAQRQALPTAAVDRWLGPLIEALVGGKAMTLFALLFGVGFSLQLQRGGGAEAQARFARRMGVLLAIGLLHAYLLWWGDILRYYAVLGLLLLICRRWSARRLILAGLFVTLLATPLLQPLVGGWPARLGDGEALRARAVAAFSGSDWPALLRANFAYDVHLHVTAWSLVFFTLGRLLLGAGFGRGGWLLRPEAHRRQWWWLLVACLPAGLLLTGFYLALDEGLMPFWMFGLEGMPARMLSRFLRNAAYLLTGLGYLSAFVLVWLRPRWQRRLAMLAPVGRMALTHYVAQTLVGVALFYGVGMGLGPRWGMPGILLVFAVLYSLQVVASHWWLARYRFGPLEWLWRCLTYGRLQPWRKVPV
ncbi:MULTISPECIES: DUF418 domain-containing protein [Pseudoxanthomonas]|jgi:uncharacterized protein|uniref:DUF418 domain-containing protein n=1 Tax=Pseudoxanthomonas winnipegensis TaxID=2480810 RepID=A0A4Q8LDT8_9GAMM|nr:MULTISPECIES: DUF418 domain-containing protein [Pseudoxanthomonas]TAA27099.1 DUF418 domain-containing protein [Pseudoxanthomonas winnipegensis]TMN20642.1 DUF418 domain-containing protein [Pseudoxanthomonas sp. X-1]UAY75745.1 DUF418 domain-containing protein [Pseudoxanthomonas sp. X-1]